MPRLLWVTPEPPDRSLSGGSIRQSYLLSAVARKMDVDVLLIGGRVAEECRDFVRGLEELPEPSVRHPPEWIPGALRVIWENEVLRMPSAVADTRDHRAILADRLRARKTDYDLVHFEHDRLAPLAHEISAPARTITLHNLRSQQARHLQQDARSLPRRWLARRTGTVARNFERRVLDDFDLVFVTSPDDAGALGAKSAVAPNGVDVERIRPAAPASEPRIVFTGKLDWQPNVMGLQWFCRHVLPRVLAEMPQTRFDVVGMNPVADVLALRQPAVQIHPNVPSVLPFLHGARVAVVPVHVGSGTRLKALEAMAAGRPVVGTTVGLAGLGLQPGVHAEVVDDPTQMAAAVLTLLRDRVAAEAMAAAARRHVEAHFDWRVISEAFSRTMLQLATGAAAA
jgi:glycosyltransferase involved in cell wall biosynthesis